MIPLSRLQFFLSYWLNAVDAHSLHSPFFYDLYKAIRKKGTPSDYQAIEKLRHSLLHDNRIIEVHDLGSGAERKPSRKVCDVARRSLSSPRFARLYHRLAARMNAKMIVELGTSFGVNTLYLAQHQSAKVYTFEGSGSIARIAQGIFDVAGASNIQLIEGDIDKTLRNFLSRSAKIDLAFMDANHRYEPTMHYFNWLLPSIHAGSLLIIDDIYHSEEMKKAWIEIKNHKLVYGSADLFQCGLIFFDPSLNKQGVVLQF